MTAKKWTVMLYLAGDNELSDDMLAGVSKLQSTVRATAKADDVRFFAFYDPLATGFPCVLYDFSREKPEELDYEIKVSKDSIFAFVKWCREREKWDEDREFALILSGHGDGFQKKSFLSDQSADSSVSIGDLGYILEVINKHLLHKKMAVLGLDSCVMSSIEFAYAMRDAAEILVASEGYVPFAGWDYASLFEKIVDPNEPEVSADRMAELMMEAFIENYTPFSDHNGLSIEIARVRLAGMEELQLRVNQFATLVINLLSAEDDTLRRGLENAILVAHHKCQTHMLDQCTDLADFVELFGKEAVPLVSSFNAEVGKVLQSRIDAIVSDIDARSVSLPLGPECKYSRGVSIYFPWSYFSYLNDRDYYLTLAFGGRPDEKDSRIVPEAWTIFLDTYLYCSLRDDSGELKKQIKDALGLEETVLPDPTGNMLDFQLDGSKVNPLNNKVNPLNNKVNPLNNKVNPLNNKVNPLNNKVNPLNNKVGQLIRLENFRRMKNFPWVPQRVLAKILKTEAAARGVGNGRKSRETTVEEDDE